MNINCSRGCCSCCFGSRNPGDCFCVQNLWRMSKYVLHTELGAKGRKLDPIWKCGIGGAMVRSSGLWTVLAFADGICRRGSNPS